MSICGESGRCGPALAAYKRIGRAPAANQRGVARARGPARPISVQRGQKKKKCCGAKTLGVVVQRAEGAVRPKDGGEA